MKAISYSVPANRSGTPKVQLVDLPVPQAKAGHVLVRVCYAGLNNFDQETSSGTRNRALAWALKRHKVVSGIEMSGLAMSDGKQIKRGDRVVGYTNIFRGPFFHAEYVVVPEHKLTQIPEDHSLEGAASLIGGALTSIAAIERIADVKPDDNILITGATGSVGITAVQLAAHLGARVSGVCHSTQTEFLAQEGATVAYAYDRNEMPRKDKQFDLVFDTAPTLSFSACTGYLKPRGTYITTMPHLDIGGFAKSLFSKNKWGYLMEADTDTKRMARLHALMQDGAFRPVVDSIYPLEQARNAFDRQLQPGKRGKILIKFGEGS
ncbi:MAG: NAD(P)-dependent alcohol dehydrogenase [Halieaceae bacterium]